jgi:hypothetical protein
MIYEPMVHLAQTVHLSCTETNTVSKSTETTFHKTIITKEIHGVRPKMISKPMVRSTHTKHLTCIKVSTLSKWIETSIHLSLVS